MSEKRRGLGRGLGALIPQAPPPGTGKDATTDRPVDVFFGDGEKPGGDTAPATDATRTTDSAPATETPANGAPNGATAKSGTEGKAAGKPGARKSVPPIPTPSGPAAIPTPLEARPTATTSDGTGDAKTDDAGAAAAGAPTGDGDLVPVPGATFAELPIGSIRRNPKQPRQVFDEEALAELVHSVREIGILQPIVVRPLREGDDSEARYELVMGERRWRAAQEAGLERVPAIVRDTQDDDMLRDALLENLHRSQLNPLEEAAAYQQLLDDFGCTHEELATRIGRSRPQISNTIRLLRLPPTVQRRVAAGVLSAGHARALLGLDEPEAMDKFAQRIVNEGLSVRATEEAVALSDASTANSPRRKPRPGGHHAELDDLASRLADRLDTRVKISLGSSKGKLSVEFASIEDLNRILEILAPGERGAFKA